MATGGGAPAAISALTSSAKRKTRWTIMIFMAAETVAGFAPLGQMAIDDLAELKKVSSNAFLDIFVQLHEDNGVSRIHVGRSESTVPTGERTHKRGQALTYFVRWVRKVAPKPRAGDRSMLVVWGHSYRFAVGQTPTPVGGIDALDFAQFTDALRRLQKGGNSDGSGKVVDIVGFDACDLSAVEVAVQLGPFADYLLASEMGIPLPGWPYDRILRRLHTPIGEVMGAAELGSFAVRRYCETYSARRAASLTLLRLSLAPKVAEGVNHLAGTLAVAVGRSSREKTLIMELFSRSQTDTDKPFVDVADLCLNLMRGCDDAHVQRAAKMLGDLLLTPAPVRPGNSETGAGRAFVQEHGRNAVRTAKLNGVSLYAPHVAAVLDVEAAQKAYQRFAFARTSLWAQLVHNLALSI